VVSLAAAAGIKEAAVDAVRKAFARRGNDDNDDDDEEEDEDDDDVGSLSRSGSDGDAAIDPSRVWGHSVRSGKLMVLAQILPIWRAQGHKVRVLATQPLQKR